MNTRDGNNSDAGLYLAFVIVKFHQCGESRISAHPFSVYYLYGFVNTRAVYESGVVLVTVTYFVNNKTVATSLVGQCVAERTHFAEDVPVVRCAVAFAYGDRYHRWSSGSCDGKAEYGGAVATASCFADLFIDARFCVNRIVEMVFLSLLRLFYTVKTRYV